VFCLTKVIDKLFDHFDETIGRQTISDRPMWDLNDTVVE